MTTHHRLKNTGLIGAIVATALVACSCHRQPMPHEKPSPARRYIVTISIDGMPSSFDSASARAFYQVTNDDCAPTMAISGTTEIPNTGLELHLTKVNGNRYTATFDLDPFLDEDYFGKGVCHWAFTSIGFTGIKGRRSFMASFNSDDLSGSGKAENYFAQGTLDDATKPLKIAGIKNSSIFGSNKTFKIDVTAKEATNDNDNR
ncbi:hypothetical protein L2Y96_07310 [Luteibacter aegosomaticola]|uniref:hypothetical protein n=1 Tax=Luteibacter aegosomaticola TaxID=2911538 RepID=UPI001FF8C595|nr:hypothetical protein [Luteibacter aegosomaticola]UPG91570.1 hypothetical protein L2Y96_07310 [Luteibacter aegosomaticola]